MELTLIRHGQSANNANGDEARHHDPPLTELGWEQARKLAAYFSQRQNIEDIVRIRTDSPERYQRHAYKFDAIYSSAMRRALETAQPIAEAACAPVNIWTELHESGGIFVNTPEGTVCYGGLTRAEIETTFPGYAVPDNVTETGWYDTHLGEEDVYACYARAMRVAKRLREMAAEHDEHFRVAIVSPLPWLKRTG